MNDDLIEIIFRIALKNLYNNGYFTNKQLLIKKLDKSEKRQNRVQIYFFPTNLIKLELLSFRNI